MDLHDIELNAWNVLVFAAFVYVVILDACHPDFSFSSPFGRIVSFASRIVRIRYSTETRGTQTVSVSADASAQTVSFAAPAATQIRLFSTATGTQTDRDAIAPKPTVKTRRGTILALKTFHPRHSPPQMTQKYDPWRRQRTEPAIKEQIRGEEILRIPKHDAQANKLRDINAVRQNDMRMRKYLRAAAVRAEVNESMGLVGEDTGLELDDVIRRATELFRARAAAEMDAADAAKRQPKGWADLEPLPTEQQSRSTKRPAKEAAAAAAAAADESEPRTENSRDFRRPATVKSKEGNTGLDGDDTVVVTKAAIGRGMESYKKKSDDEVADADTARRRPFWQRLGPLPTDLSRSTKGISKTAADDEAKLREQPFGIFDRPAYWDVEIRATDALDEPATDQAAAKQATADHIAAGKAVEAQIATEQDAKDRDFNEVDQAVIDRITAEKAIANRMAAEKAAAEKATADQVAAIKAAKEKAIADAIAAEKAAADQAAVDSVAAYQAAQAAKDQAAKDQATKVQAIKDQAAKDRSANDQAENDQAAKDQAANDQAAKDHALKAFKEQLGKSVAAYEAAAKDQARKAAKERLDKSIAVDESAAKQAIDNLIATKKDSPYETIVDLIAVKIGNAEKAVQKHLAILAAAKDQATYDQVGKAAKKEYAVYQAAKKALAEYKAANKQPAKANAANKPHTKDQAIKDQAAKAAEERIAKDKADKEQLSKEKAIKAPITKGQATKTTNEPLAKDQAVRDEAAKAAEERLAGTKAASEQLTRDKAVEEPLTNTKNKTAEEQAAEDKAAKIRDKNAKRRANKKKKGADERETVAAQKRAATEINTAAQKAVEDQKAATYQATKRTKDVAHGPTTSGEMGSQSKAITAQVSAEHASKPLILKKYQSVNTTVNTDIPVTEAKCVPRGITNGGVECYINASLQLLTHTPKFVDWINKHNKSALCGKSCGNCILKEFINFYWTTENIILKSATNLKTVIGRTFHSANLNRGRQEDAAEFLLYWLGETSRGEILENHPLFYQFWEETRCQTCDHVKQRILDPENDLPLPIDACSTLEEALEQFFAVEEIEWSCSVEGCQEKFKKRHLAIETRPEILRITLKLWHLDPKTGDFVKNTRAIQYEQQLDLTKFQSPQRIENGDCA